MKKWKYGNEEMEVWNSSSSECQAIIMGLSILRHTASHEIKSEMHFSNMPRESPTNMNLNLLLTEYKRTSV